MEKYNRFEQEIIDFFEFNDVANCSSICEPKVFEMIAMKCFLENLSGKHVNAVRAIVKNIKNCSIYRGTPEYANMLERILH